MYLRSAIKPLQVLPLVESGAATRFGVSARELALACASHGGEPDHVAARGWLAQSGRCKEDLICGAVPPLGREAAETLIPCGKEPSPLHNNCSGKHLGFLTVAMHLGVPINDYGHPEHPVQCRVRRVLSELGGADLAWAPVAGDGCGVRCWLCRGSPSLVRSRSWRPPMTCLARERQRARRFRMTSHPCFIAGTHRFDTLVIERAAGAMLVKGGAEGVCAAVLPERGLGFAVKIYDGAKRAAENGDGRITRYECCLRDDRRIPGEAGRHALLPVGSIRPARGWPG